MSFAPVNCLNYPGQPKNVAGVFTEVEFGHHFEYTPSRETAPWPEYPVQVWCGPNGETRWAKLAKTRAYIVTDEAADGSPVVEKWVIRAHREYP